MSLAVDTNVLTRALTDDGTEQSDRALACLLENEVLIPETVLLETEWVLRSRFNASRADVMDLFRGLLSLRGVHFPDRRRVANAVLAHAEGLDFADALHLFAAERCEAMITFDEDFIRRAKKIAQPIEVRRP
jgi:predicted nucleic-acid-binding protein